MTSKKAARVGISALVLVSALGLLFFITVRDGAQYYKHVDEVTQNPQIWYGKGMQLHGFAQSIQVRRNSLDYQFDVQNNGKVIKASYTGVVPDTFKDGAEVVLKGRLGPGGFVVEHDGVLAKCPSKYNPAGNAGQPGQ
jgi:cytochrome c-type biogenesis protein CcmE